MRTHFKNLLMVILLGANCGAGAQVAKKSCDTASHRQFDFWAGDWDVYDAATKTMDSHIVVDILLDGCVLRERYEDTNGLKGQSFSIYDATRGVWHQTWVTNRGQLLTVEGKFDNGSMSLRGSDKTAKGENEMVKVSWTPQPGGLREVAHTSIDGGKTWKEWFDLEFRPAASQNSKPKKND